MVYATLVVETKEEFQGINLKDRLGVRMVDGKTFAGANVFMSRNLVPPEVFDALLDALQQNGADVFLCCDASRNGPNDYHVIVSPDHEKFELLKAKGCHLLGPQCILSCAKERRMLPKKDFACCLAMDGAKVLISGFDLVEKENIESMVKRMGGVMLTKSSSNVNFVIVKDVLAAKYKWALNILKKPILTLSWLYQCWNEHRLVPQDPFRVLPFSGLTISVTKINTDERKDIEKAIIQNGGKYSPELTKMCTHLIAQAPEGDKYKVARRWGHIHIVSRKWFDNSISRKACLDEGSYSVLSVPPTSSKMSGGTSLSNHFHDKSSKTLGKATSSPSTSFTGCENSDLEATLSQNMNSILSDPYKFTQDTHKEGQDDQFINGMNAVTSDSQSDESIQYLSKCIVALVGFSESEMQKLVDIIRRGGGTQRSLATSFLTHVVVGSPSETEKKDIRNIAALGVIDIAKASWLEDCHRAKKAVDVLRNHAAYELLIPKDSELSMNDVANTNKVHQKNVSDVSVPVNVDSFLEKESSRNEWPPKCNELSDKLDADFQKNGMAEKLNAPSKTKRGIQTKIVCSKDEETEIEKSFSVFQGKCFCFSESFPDERRGEIIEWIIQGGGRIVSNCSTEVVQYTIECHGIKRQNTHSLQTTYVSSHWIKSCLEAGSLVEVSSHLLFSPLPCNVPLPGFEGLRFCISQYEENERSLMRNLCFVLGAKFVEKLTKKVTHLLCKFSFGPKFEAASKWSICTVTCDWVYECIRQNNVVATNLFFPKEVAAQDQAHVCAISQFPTHSTLAVTQDHKTARVIKENDPNLVKSSALCSANIRVAKKLKYNNESPRDDADVSASIEVIEGLYDLTHDKASVRTTTCDSNLFPAEYSVESEGHEESFDKDHVSRSAIGLSKLWANKSSHTDDFSKDSKDTHEDVYNWSETQTESQVVGYEEDLSGRQMLIDKIRLRTSFT